jgi:hypothetical protein
MIFHGEMPEKEKKRGRGPFSLEEGGKRTEAVSGTFSSGSSGVRNFFPEAAQARRLLHCANFV